MYILFDRNNKVLEIIPEEDPHFPGVPVTERYAPDFVVQLVRFPEGTKVAQNWTYDPDKNEFIPDGTTAAQYTADDMFKALLGTLASESGGGGNIS